MWIAFIPLLFSNKKATAKEAYASAVLAGTVAACLAFPWLIETAGNFMGIPAPFNYLVWIVYGLYQAQLLGIIFCLFAYLRKKTTISEILLFPIVMVAVWSFFPTIFFFNLCNGTTGFKAALQCIDTTGAYGLDFIIALFNILIFKILENNSKRDYLGLIVGLAILLAWFGAGSIKTIGWQKKTIDWEIKRIGIVQPNVVPSLYAHPDQTGSDDIKFLESELTLQIVKENPDIVIWPEGSYKGYFEDLDVQKALGGFVEKIGIPLITHDYPRDYIEGEVLYRNSAVFINGDGCYGGRYDKRYLVPFGEYIPFLDYNNSLVKLFDLRPPITPGKHPVSFQVKQTVYQPLICYEIQFDRFVAESLNKKAKGAILIVQSNDGWYGRGAEAAQHNSSTILRAIENRVPVIHVVNNGKSTAVSPNGHVIFTSDFWVRGSWVVDLPFNSNSGGSFFTKHPGLFINIVRALFLLLLFDSFLKPGKSAIRRLELL
ncbi:MAG: apolipoprotein N-acyltransferase [Bacteroidetes bacterium]|nr:apolipoprotein N-acyltransferase [Bacteroidota bacterium]